MCALDSIPYTSPAFLFPLPHQLKSFPYQYPPFFSLLQALFSHFPSIVRSLVELLLEKQLCFPVQRSVPSSSYVWHLRGGRVGWRRGNQGACEQNCCCVLPRGADVLPCLESSHWAQVAQDSAGQKYNVRHGMRNTGYEKHTPLTDKL